MPSLLSILNTFRFSKQTQTKSVEHNWRCHREKGCRSRVMLGAQGYRNHAEARSFRSGPKNQPASKECRLAWVRET
jgi:hypothetical protein